MKRSPIQNFLMATLDMFVVEKSQVISHTLSEQSYFVRQPPKPLATIIFCPHIRYIVYELPLIIKCIVELGPKD